jgi:hypothetical protein
MNKILLYILLTINAFGLDLQLITKIPSSELLSSGESNAKELPTGFSIKYIRKDAGFIAGNSPEPQSVVVTDSGKYVSFDFYYSTYLVSTNIVSIVKEANGDNTFTIDVLSRSFSTNNTGISILKTISSSGYISEQNVNIGESTYRYIVNSQGTKQEYLGASNYTFNIFTKFDSKWKPISSIKVYGRTSNQSSAPFNLEEKDVNSKQIITYELKDGYIYFYRLTDSDLLSSPNRITLGASQNGSLTATVNNPEQALLNIQSSTNLIDWNTFKTIQNEPSLEIVVPANKPKEFIRAIE